MAIVTGKNCTISIGTQQYEGVVNNYELAFDTQATEYQTLAGPLAGPGSETGTLSLTWAYDSGETNSLFDDIWDAADAGTPIAYVAVVGGSQFSGNCVAARPNVPADAEGVSECSVEMALDGIPTKAAYTPPPLAAKAAKS